MNEKVYVLIVKTRRPGKGPCGLDVEAYAAKEAADAAFDAKVAKSVEDLGLDEGEALDSADAPRPEGEVRRAEIADAVEITLRVVPVK